MPKRSNNPTDKKPKVKRTKRSAPVVNRQLQFVAVHNQALKNLARDETHAQRIAAKIKEESDDLSDVRLEELMKRRKELLK